MIIDETGAQRQTGAAWTLEPEVDVVPKARRLARGVLAAWGLEDAGADILLLVTELVTNAVRHAGTRLDLALQPLEGGVVVSVTDRYAERALPVAPRLPADDAESSRGLYIVSKLASRWGVEYAGDGKRVWAVVPTSGEPAAGEGMPTDALVGRMAARRATTELKGLDELCEALTMQALEDLEADAAYCYLAGEDDATFELRCSTGDADPARALPRVPTREGLLSRLSDRPMPIVSGNVESDHLPIATPDARYPSLVAVPMLTGDRLIGVVFCTAAATDRFTTADGARLQRLTDERVVTIGAARVVELDRRRRGRLAFVAQASELLSTTLDPTMTISMLSQLLVSQLAEWCVVHEVSDRGDVHLMHVWHADETRLDGLRAAFDAEYPSPTTPATGIVLGGLRGADNVVRVGMVARGRTLAVVTAGRTTAPYAVDEVRLIEDVVRRAALALDNARLHTATTYVSETLQQSLLPPDLPSIPGCDVAAVYQPTGDTALVGGDFYDVFAVGDGSFGLAVGDVCGKGPQAAAVTGLARHALRLLTRAGHEPSEVLARLNSAILDEGERSRFVTLLFALVRPSASGVSLRLCSAGHPLPLVVSPTGDVTTVGTPQPLLGVLDDVSITPDDVFLPPGHTLVCFTDGVTERRSGNRMLGGTGLRRLLAGCAETPAAAVVRRIAGAVEAFADVPPADDIAVVALRALGE